MPGSRVVLFAFAASACVPNDSRVTSGRFVAFLAEGASASLAAGAVDPSDDEWSFSYNIDCRDFATPAEERRRRLPNAIDLCDDEKTWPPEHEQWADRAAFQVVGQDVETYRGDAMVNYEGDVQFTFHHELPGGEDFRWVFAVDPHFQPTRCVGDGQGGVVREDLDGDWIEEWSRELRALDDANLPAGLEYLEGLTTDGRLYFVNARGYQIAPDFASTADEDDRWFLPQQWSAAAATGRFSEDFVEERASRYGEPALYEGYESLEPNTDAGDLLDPANLWFCDADELPAGADPTDNLCMIELGERMQTVEAETTEELLRLASPDGFEDETSALFSFRPLVHLNDWRAPDALAPGFDGWGEIHYSFVVFDPESRLEVGGSASGAFQLFLEGQGSTSRVLLKGTFETDRIRDDRWGAQDLFADQAEENGAELCFEQ